MTATRRTVNHHRGQRSTQAERSAQQFAAWLNRGIALRITLVEAYRLTGGAYGDAWDTTTLVNLSTVAKAVTK